MEPGAAPAPVRPPSRPFWVAPLGWAAFTAAFIYGLAYADLTLRARSAYLEGEKYMAWSSDPKAKAAFFDAELSKRTGELKAEFERGKMTKEELAQRLALAKFSRDEAVAESSLKYAYVWYQTAVELFSPPESRWVVLSRAKMGRAKEAWKAELRAKKIPFEDYMLD